MKEKVLKRLYNHFADRLMFFFVQTRLDLVAMMVAMETMSQMVIVVFINEQFC